MYVLVRARRETAGVNPQKFEKMQTYFKKYLNKEFNVDHKIDSDTGAAEITFSISGDSGLEALTSSIIAVKAAAQKAEVHLYIQKVEVEGNESEETGEKEYSITFRGICH